MQVIGIVAEYNPFHTGHTYQISESRKILGFDAPVVIVMSGNWVQQASCAIADKWLRAKMALLGGTDLILELPTVWATASAEKFARGAVSLLHASAVVSHLSFGSEQGNILPLQKIASCLDSPDYLDFLHHHISSGMSFAACRQNAIQALLGPEYAVLLSHPNNNLGIEYLRSLNLLHSSISPMTILRNSSSHNEILWTQEEDNFLHSRPQFVSATQIRTDLYGGTWSRAEPYLIHGGQTLSDLSHGLPEMSQISRAILAKLRTMTAEDWAALPDSGQSEGLPQRLERAGQACSNITDFYERVKTKRYTYARLRRLVLWAYLGMTKNAIPSSPPYLRVLGFNARGQYLLKEMKERAHLPILTKPAHAKHLDPVGQHLFQLEARCTDLYDLCFQQIPAPGREWVTGPVVLK